MWNRVIPIYLFLILAVLSGSVACSRRADCEEKMLAMEGYYYITTHPDAIPPEESVYSARIMKTGDRWFFSFTIPIKTDNGTESLHKFEQGVLWSPEIKDYLFDHLSPADYELLKVDYVVTRYDYYKGKIIMEKKYRSDDGSTVIGSHAWVKVR